MLGSSLIFSTIMLVGMLFMPESPRFLMHKGKTLEAFDVWKRIRGTQLQENREEFFVMKHSVIDELESSETRSGSFAWLDFFTVPRARRSIVYANIMIFLGQSALNLSPNPNKLPISDTFPIRHFPGLLPSPFSLSSLIQSC